MGSAVFRRRCCTILFAFGFRIAEILSPAGQRFAFMPDPLQQASAHSHRHHHRSRPGPLFPTVCFALHGVLDFVLVATFFYLRPGFREESVGGLMGLAVVLAVFGVIYFWVSYAVYRRRKYIFDIALVFAGLGLLNIPLGTLLSMFLLSSLMERKYDFTK